MKWADVREGTSASLRARVAGGKLSTRRALRDLAFEGMGWVWRGGEGRRGSPQLGDKGRGLRRLGLGCAVGAGGREGSSF